MKITNTLVLVAAVGLLGACEKSSTDTANPDDATTPAEPATDDFSSDPVGDPADDGLGEEDPMGEDGAEGEEPAEGEEAAEGEEPPAE